MLKLQFKDSPERSIWLVGDKATIGAAADNTITLTGSGVKDYHAEIHINGNTLHLHAESGSCIVNELPVEDGRALLPEDELRIGKDVLTIIDPKASLASAESLDSAAKAVETGWSLLPDHPKLNPEDFSIQPYTVIGRSKDCQFTVPYKLLSREHAALSVKDNQLSVTDLGSANGCFVNGERVTEAVLKQGDKVAFAKLGFTVQGPDNEPANNLDEESGADPDKEPAADDNAASLQQMNITMMRPAVKLDELAAAEVPESADPVGPLTAGEAGKPGSQSESQSEPRLKLWPIILLILTISIAAGWYMLNGA